MTHALVGLAIVLAVIGWAALERAKRGSAEDRTEATSTRLRKAVDEHCDFIARKRRDAAKLKRNAQPSLPPGSMEPAAKMPPQMPVPARRRSRRRARSTQ